ncbi:hypothetical protein IFM89_008559 [Coptis chinensis]|uniref:Uncharacterized protein n=1 Tax=Coptis chinensis TaxID=261450 RepID=A0A835LYY1_9MAGN|nr:hypothetical protein IFM89_008559 [Coptis chinensis]
MTIVTVDSSQNLNPNAIPVIDLRCLSQSELNTLCLYSSAAQSSSNTCNNDIVIPKIDRSVFNESAGSRKQTYSRLRLAAPRKPDISTVGRGRYNNNNNATQQVPKPQNTTTTTSVDDPERKENKEIVAVLRGLFGKDNTDIKFKESKVLSQELATVPLVVGRLEEPREIVSINGGKKRRGRPRKDDRKLGRSNKVRRVAESEDFYENVTINENVVMEIVNRNGVVVDLAVLGSSVDPFGVELRRRTDGLTTEEELLAFLRNLDGQWGSRRKKRKVVDASDFGDALPIGWKLLLSLKRKEGSVSLYCRRYISPTGQQFVSCKEVSSYLLPYFGFQDENHPNSLHSDESEYDACRLSSGSSAGLTHKDASTKEDLSYYAASSITSYSADHEKQLILLGTENLAEVEIKDLLECHICKMNFDEKDAYLQHLLSSHQKSAKRSRQSSTSVCDGVIIRDGKFECQFCHKIFDERRRYNGHVGVHVRNYVRSLEATPGDKTKRVKVNPSFLSGLLPGSSRVDPSVEMDMGSDLPISLAGSKADIDSLGKLDEGSNWDMGSDPTFSAASNKANIGSRGKMDEESNQDMGSDPTFSAASNKANIGSRGKMDEESNQDMGSDPPTSVTSEKANIDARSKLDAGSNLDMGSDPPASNEVNVDSHGFNLESLVEASVEMDKGSGRVTFISGIGTDIHSHRKLDEGLNLDIYTEKSNSEQNSLRSNPDSVIYNLHSLPAKPNVENVETFDNLMSKSLPETPSPKSNCEPKVVSPYGKKDIQDRKIVEDLSGESGDKQDNDIELTDDKLGKIDQTNNNLDCDPKSCMETTTALFDNVERVTCESYEGKDVFTKTAGGELGKVDQTSNNLDFNLSSCLDPTAALCKNVAYGTSETYKGKSAFTRTSDCELDKVDLINNNLDGGDLRSCLESATSMCNNNVENGSFDTYESNVLTSTTFDINLSGAKQGEGSFSFSDLLCKEIANGAGNYTNKVFSANEKDPKLDEAKESGFNELENSFGINRLQEYPLIETIGSADRENIMHNLVADPSSHLLQSAGCFPTLDLMSNKSEGCFPTLDLMSNKGQVESDNFPLQRFENMSSFDELGFDDLAPSKFGFVTGQESSSLTQVPPSKFGFVTGQVSSSLTQAPMDLASSKFGFVTGQESSSLTEAPMDLASSKFGFVTGQESSSLTQAPMDLGYDSVLHDALHSTVQFGWQPVLPNNSQQHTSVCVWCRIPFSHEPFNPEMQSDSVGFMCPTCKAKISGQLYF